MFPKAVQNFSKSNFEEPTFQNVSLIYICNCQVLVCTNNPLSAYMFVLH